MRLTPTALVIGACLAGCGGSTSSTTPPPPPPAAVASVTLSQANAALVPGATVQLSASVKDAGGNVLTDRTVTWTSSAAAVASVSSTGLVTGVTAGSATVTATAEGKNAAATITVAAGAVIGAAGGSVTSVDGNATVVIPAGALSQATPISIVPATGTPLDSTIIPGTAYDFQPTGTQFSASATIRIKYDPSNLTSGIPLITTQLNVVSNGVWSPVSGSSVDTVGHIVSAPVSHFSDYAAEQGPVWMIGTTTTAGDYVATRIYPPLTSLTVCVNGVTSTFITGSPSHLFTLPAPIMSNSNPSVAAIIVAAGNETLLITGITPGTTTITANYMMSFSSFQPPRSNPFAFVVTVVPCPAANVPIGVSLHDGVTVSDNVYIYNGSGTPQAVSSTGQSRYVGIGFSPGGTLLYGLRYLGGLQPAEKVFWSGLSGAVTTIPTPSPSIPTSAGTFLGNGGFLFASPVGLTTNIWGVPLGGTTATQLTNFNGTASDIAVSPDGSLYLTWRGTVGGDHIFNLPIPPFGGPPVTSGLIPITSGSLIEGTPAVSQNGQTLAYEQFDAGFTKSQIMIQSTATPGATPTAITPANGFAFVPSFCGNEFIYYAWSTSFNGPYQLMRYNTALNTTAPLPAFTGMAVNDLAVPRTDGDHGLHVCP